MSTDASIRVTMFHLCRNEELERVSLGEKKSKTDL